MKGLNVLTMIEKKVTLSDNDLYDDYLEKMQLVEIFKELGYKVEFKYYNYRDVDYVKIKVNKIGEN